MKRVLLILAALMSCSAAHAQMVCPTTSGDDVVIGREAITVSSTAVGFTVNTYNPPGGAKAKYAFVRLETNNIRISNDGTAPTAAVGQLVETSTNVGFWVCGQPNVARFLAIRTTSDAAITAVYYGLAQ